jgi:hypothetical protein
MGVDRLARSLRAIGGQKTTQIGQPRIAVLGDHPGDPVDALALATGARERQR